jgi:hypothetical protein
VGISFNPLIFSGLVNIPAAGAVTWRGSVPTEGDLPSTGNSLGDAIAVQDSGKIYVWSGTPAKWHDTGITTAEFGNTPNADGASIITDDTNPLIRKDTLVLQPADATHPGGVSTEAQTFAGNKTFQNEVIVQGSIDAQAGIDSSTGTLDIGATATTINIGAAGATITIQGDTTYEHVTNLYVKDKTITLNDGGAAGSAGGAGIEIEEDVLGTQQITGYAQVSSDRDAWELKAPNQAGVAVIDAGAAGITINQSSHDPVTLGVVGSIPNLNGATLTNQVLNLEPADSTNPGVVTTTTQTFAGEKTFEEDVIVEGEIDAQLGINSSTSSLDIGLTTDTVNIGKSTGTTDIVGTVTIEYNPADPTDWAPAPTHVIEAIDQLADRFVEQDQVTNEPTGFVNRTSSELVFTDGGLIPRNFEIKVKAPATSFTFYVKGKKFTKSTTESIQISADLGDHYIYYDNNGVLQETIDPDEIKIIIQERAFVAVVYWNNETNSHTYFADERHGLTMDGVTHAYLHTVFGSRYLSGFGLDNFNLLAPSFQADIGSFRDEDILHQVTTQIDEIPILYRFGANNGWRKKAADTYPVIYQGSTADYPAGIIRLPYNEYTGAAWQLTEIDNNKYVLVHFFATNDIDNPIVGIQGTAPHESISDAKNAANTEITQLSGLPFTEFVPIGSVVFQSSVVSKASPTYSDIQLIDGANYIDFRGTQLYTPAGTATTHGLLSGLGNDDHLQYLLADGTRTMGGALNMGTHQINNVVDPTSAQDAATKNYVDAAITGTTSYFAGFDSTTGLLTEVPGYTFDDNGTLQIGAQNSLTVPAGLTDYISIGISPTIANPGLTNLSGVQLNSPIDQTVTNYEAIQVFGYGTDKPDNFTAYRSQTNYTGVGTNITHFTAGGGSDCTGSVKAFQFNSAGDAGTIQGVTLNPSGDATTIEGISFVPSGSYTDATGIKVDLSSATVTNRPIGLDITQGTLNSTVSFTTVPSVPTLVDSGNVIRPVFEVKSGSPITDSDVLMTNLAGFMDFKDSHSGTALLDLGVASVGFVSQVAVDAAKTADNISMCLAGLAVDATSAGGSVTDAHLYRGSAFTFGGALTIDNLYGLKIENTLSDKATNSWGISVEDTGAENYLAKSLKIGGSTATTNNEIALEIGSNKSIRVGLVTTAQRTALANLSGLVVYDTDLNKFFGNDGSQWIQLNLSIGDIDQTTFNALAGQSLQDVDDFVFSNAVTRGFEAIVTIERASTYAEYSLKGIQRGASWEMSQDYIGDDTGITFNITSGGQVQYSSTAGSSATIKFRAKTV